MSRTLLSTRLKELTAHGIVTKCPVEGTRHTEYQLTSAGEALRSVVFGMADWSQEWLQIEPSLENIDPDHLMWNLRRSARSHPDLPSPFVVHIYLSEQPKDHQNAWLVFKGDAVELCIVDHGFEVDVQVEATTRNLTRFYMGWCDYSEAVEKGELIVRGPERFTSIAEQWLGRSRLANIEKQPEALLIS